MENYKKLYTDLQAALRHCGLDPNLVLEDYYEYEKDQTALKREHNGHYQSVLNRANARIELFKGADDSL